MRKIITLLTASLLATAVHAGEDCRPEYLGAEDLAIMASVRPDAVPATGTLLAGPSRTPDLTGVVAIYGQLGEEDLSIIRSVQPKGAKIVLCPSSQPMRN